MDFRRVKIVVRYPNKLVFWPKEIVKFSNCNELISRLFYSLKSCVLSWVSEFERQVTFGIGRESGETGTWTPLSHSCRHGSESDQ